MRKHPFTPENAADYAICSGVFALAAVLIVAIGIWGIGALAGVRHWQLHATIYMINVALGVTFCCGAAMFCLNHIGAAPETEKTDFFGRCRRILTALAIELAALLLALVQLAATAILVLIIGMLIFGQPLPSLHTTEGMLRPWL